MKTCWIFRFKAVDFKFERNHIFEGTATVTDREQAKPVPLELPFLAEIVPAVESDRKPTEQHGKLLLTINGRPEDNQEFAYVIADGVTENISLHHGEMRINWAFIMAERISENSDEADEIGNEPFWLEMRMQEVLPSPAFDSNKLSTVNINSRSAVLLRQFNSTKQINNPIDRFLGLFKILEYQYHSGKSKNIEKALLQSSDFTTIAIKVLSLQPKKIEITPDEQGAFEFVKSLVKIRHHCAHLRRNFGYSVVDDRILTEVEPCLPLLEECAYETVVAGVKVRPSGEVD